MQGLCDLCFLTSSLNGKQFSFMCGIAGVITKDTEHALDTIKLMTDIITHRGPEADGFHYDTNFIFGHRKLSIIDLSGLGKQPMCYFGNIITYNGEIYNYIELREELVLKGYQFASRTDTEVILAAYDFWGEDCVNKFNGMWSFAIYDKKRNVIFCSRDRFGIKPFYYTQFNNNFYFGSEIKQFTVLPGWISKCNKLRANDYFIYGISNHSKETLFADVFQLTGGNNLVFDLNTFTFQVTTWYNPVIETDNRNKDIRVIAGKVKALFFDAVSLQLRSDVKVGVSLSGGIDSSSIACAIDHLSPKESLPGNRNTVSACFAEKECNEEPFVDIVTKQTGSLAHKISPSFDDLFSQLDSIVWHQDEPFQSTSIFAQWSMFKAASTENITVMLDGQGADEYLAGYESFYGILLADYLRNAHLMSFLGEIKGIYQSYGFAKTLKSFQWLLNVVLYRMPFVSENFRISIKSKMLHKTTDWLKLKRDGLTGSMHKKANSSLKNMSIQLLSRLSMPTLLQYADRNSMAFSIESRMPFLDYRLVEYILSLPNSYKIHKSKTKYIFREAMKDVLPDVIRSRKDKIGFATPQEQWVKQNSKFFRKKIEESCDILEVIIDKNNILKWYDNSIKKGLSFDYNFWNLICFARWVKVYNIELV